MPEPFILGADSMRRDASFVELRLLREGDRAVDNTRSLASARAAQGEQRPLCQTGPWQQAPGRG
eukprot:21335-Lingulodinium_polyedra.AAC.1